MKKEKVVLAFSGGLDTSFCVKYLSEEKGYEVHTAIANTGGFSPAELKVIEQKALALGAASHVTLDIEQEYYEKSIKYMVFGNILRNGTYPISVSSERIFQAIAIIEYAKKIGADYVAHGSTGAGNDQVRFDLTFQILAPEIGIITPTRDMTLTREYEIDYLKKHGYEADFKKLEYSINKGLWGTSIGGKETLHSEETLPEEAYPSQVTEHEPRTLRIAFERGEIAAVDGKPYADKVEAIRAVEAIGAKYGIGRAHHRRAQDARKAYAHQVAALLEGSAFDVVRHVPPRGAVPRTRDARHRALPRPFAGERDGRSGTDAASLRLYARGRAVAAGPDEDRFRRVRRSQQGVDGRRREGLHEDSGQPDEDLLQRAGT